MKRASEIMRAVSDGNFCRSSPEWAAGDGTTPLSRYFSGCRAWAVVLALAVGLAMMLVTTSARAQTETVLYRFTGSGALGTGVDSATPFAGLVRDAAGNLYGTTLYGGNSTGCSFGPGCGTVFELVNSSGGHTEKVLYNFDTFTAAGSDTGYPYAGLIMDASGNLFGTTYGGPAGYGTVFELVNSSGTYTEKLLYTFTDSGGDGALPKAGLVMDSSGNLYGTTVAGGTSGQGTVFELVNSSGTYSEKVLYSFTGTGGDGASPAAGLIMDSSGNLYGTTVYGGGPSDCGTVFELVNSSGGYTEKVLYSLTGGNDAYPLAGLIMDASGDLYGTASDDGGSGGGEAFELVNLFGKYTEKVLHNFTGYPGDGADPKAGLVMDASGNLYGTTSAGGASGDGAVFELVNSSGTYAAKLLYSFTGASGDGNNPVAGLVMDSNGNLYGTTAYGGTFPQTGTVFELTPAASPAVTLTPATLTFSSQTVGAAGAAQTVTLTNSGTATLSSTVISITGANAGDYSQTNNCGTSVAPSANCTINVSFKPTAAGTRTASVSIADNATGSPQSVALSGTGAAATPTVSLAPTDLTFASQTVGTTSSAQDITVNNTGTADLSITGLTIAGTNAGDYSQSNNCGSNLKVGAFCNISVAFKPIATGTRTASVSIADNASGSPQAVAMSGTAVAATPAVTLSPTSLTFASQTVGASGTAQSITLTNSGTETLSSIAISITGADASDYSQTNTCGTSVAASANCTISVTFKPTAAGTRTASVSIADNASTSPQTVVLSGTGATPALGDFAFSASPASLTVTAGSSGMSTLTVTPANGFNQPVTFTCSGLPSQSTCRFSPASVAPSGAAVTSKVTIATTATTTSMNEPSMPGPFSSHMTIALAGVFACFFSLGGIRKRRNRWLSLFVLIAGLAVLAGCGGSSKMTTMQGTTPGTYTVTVTATSGSGTSALSHSATVSLTVQ